jgi:putative aldouronate transport system permease protein
MVRRIPVVSVILVVLVLAISAVPLIYLITVSFFTQASYYGSELRVTLSNLRVFALPAFVRSIEVSLATAAAGSILSLAVTIAAAYGFFIFYTSGSGTFPLPARMLLGGFLLLLVFNGGIVPLYMVVRHLRLVDTYASLFVPYLLNFLLVLYCLEQFRQVPASLLEAGRLEGLRETGILVRIIVPLKIRLLVSLGIVHFVLHWNNWYPGVLYINSPAKRPVQVFLRDLLFSDQSFQQLGIGRTAISPPERMSFVLMSILPVLLAYGFLLLFNRKGKGG